MLESTSRPSRRLPEGADLLLRGTPGQILARIADGDPLGLRAVVGGVLAARCLLLDPDRLLLLAFADVARSACRWGGQPALGRWLEAQVHGAVDQLLVEESRALPRPTPDAVSDSTPDAVHEGPPAYSPGATFESMPPVDPEDCELVPLDLGDPLESARAAAPGGAARKRPRLSPAEGRPENPEGSAPVLAALARPLGLNPQGLRMACAAFNARPESERRAFDALVLGRDSLDEVVQSSSSSASAVGRRARRVLDAILEAVLSLPSGGLSVPVEAADLPVRSLESATGSQGFRPEQTLGGGTSQARGAGTVGTPPP